LNVNISKSMNKGKQKCPMPQTHGRLNEVFRLWHEAAEAYQEPDLFNMKLNAVIQAVRNVTFIMQSELSKHPDFNGWYKKQREKLASEKFMVKLRDSRNYVVKQGDLKKKSIAKVRILTHKNNPILTEVVSPTLTLPDLLEHYKGSVQNPNPHWDVVLEIERNWIVNNFPEKEILLIIRDAYILLYKIIEDWHVKQGFNIDQCHNPGIKKDDFFRIMDLTKFFRLRASLNDGRKIDIRRKPFQLPHEMEKKAVKMYGIDKGGEETVVKPDWKDGPWGKINYFMKTAQQILKADKYHHPMFHIFKGDAVLAVCPVAYTDRPSKYLAMREMAQDVGRLQADGFVFISETWRSEVQYDNEGNLLPPDKVKNKVETLTIFIATADGRNKGYQAKFRRNMVGRIKFEKTTSFDLGEDSFLSPFIEIWNKE